jgi:hypothetical protein
MLIRLIATLGMANLALIVPLAASAQDVPSYAQGDPAQYAQQGPPPSYATQDQQIHGRVISFDGGYSLQVRDDRGYVDNVQLHQGTVINPTGLTLASGMVVSINGYANGNAFSANEIDTPYQFYGAVPYYGGYPWYHYDSGISLGFFFGNTGWWHGDYYGHPAYFVGGLRTYNVGLYFGSGGYGGGYWHGRDYVAPYHNGGYVPYSHGGYRSPQGYAPPQGGYHGPVNGGGYRSPQGYAPHGGPSAGYGRGGVAPRAPVTQHEHASSNGDHRH